jgi:hypothetical protein
MPNYIDKDKLIRDLIDNRNFYPAIVKRAIENAPTEDVVPRSEVEKFIQEIDHIQKDKAEIKYLKEHLIEQAKQEVAKQIFEEIRQEIKLALDSNYKAKDEHLNKYKDYDAQFISLVNGKILSLRGIDDFLDELKKKYIGE